MNISATGLISSLTPTAPTSSVTSAQTTANTASPLGGADSTQLSTMGQLMSKLQSLESSDPTKAKQVLTSIATALTNQANSSGTTDPHLKELANKFTQAASTGDLSALKPQSTGHHHHHAAQAASTDASTAATASYTQSGSDPMSQVESIISTALSGATTTT